MVLCRLKCTLLHNHVCNSQLCRPNTPIVCDCGLKYTYSVLNRLVLLTAQNLERAVVFLS